MDSYDVQVQQVQFQLYDKQSLWTFNIIIKQTYFNIIYNFFHKLNYHCHMSEFRRESKGN